MKKIFFLPFLVLPIILFPSQVKAAATELVKANQFCNFTTTGAGTTGQTSGDVTLSAANYPEGCVVYENVNGVSSGDLTVDNTILVLHKILTFDPGQKIDVVNGGRIWINTGGEIEQGKLCVKDADNDHYADTTTVTTDPNTGLALSTTVTQIQYAVADTNNICPAGYNFKESMNDLTMVDNDTATNDSSKISTSDRELLRLGFTLAGVTDALAAAGDVQVINKNMLICTAGTCPTTNFAADSGSLYVAGNVGIGTPTPQKNLEVYSPGGGSLRLSSDDVFASGIQFYSYGGSQEYSRIQLNSESNGLEIWNNISYPIVFGTNNLERVRVSESGNVGIGTTSPGKTLDVSGSFRTSNQGIIGNSVAKGNPSTTDITSTAHALLGGYGGNYLAFGQYSTSDQWIQSAYAVPSTATYDLVLQPLGSNVGIGTTAPTSKLQISGDLRIDGGGLLNNRGQEIIETDASDYFRINAGGSYTNGTAAYGNWSFGSGKVSIGTWTPSATYTLNVVGSLYASGSSRDFKQNIKPLEIDSSKIYQLTPVSYDYKPEYKDYGYNLAGGHQIGLIAEDVAKIYPELAITLNRDGVKNKVSNVDYEKLSILLLAEMKNQKKEIDSLQQKVDYLEQKLIDIETKLK